MIQETQLLVLNAVRYSDTSYIVHTYSAQYGPLHLKVSRSSRRQAIGTRAFFTPLSLLDVTLDFRAKKEVQIPMDTHLIYSPSCITRDPIGNAVALFLTELFFRLFRNEEPDRHLFDLVSDEIKRMDLLSSGELANFHLVLILKLLPLLGIMPDFQKYNAGMILLFDEGQFVRPLYEHQREEVGYCRIMRDITIRDNPYTYPLDRTQRNGLLHYLLSYLSHHFPSVSDLKSPEILSHLFV